MELAFSTTEKTEEKKIPEHFLLFQIDLLFFSFLKYDALTRIVEAIIEKKDDQFNYP